MSRYVAKSFAYTAKTLDFVTPRHVKNMLQVALEELWKDKPDLIVRARSSYFPIVDLARFPPEGASLRYHFWLVFWLRAVGVGARNLKYYKDSKQF